MRPSNTGRRPATPQLQLFDPRPCRVCGGKGWRYDEHPCLSCGGTGLEADRPDPATTRIPY